LKGGLGQLFRRQGSQEICDGERHFTGDAVGVERPNTAAENQEYEGELPEFHSQQDTASSRKAQSQSGPTANIATWRLVAEAPPPGVGFSFVCSQTGAVNLDG
jgi:hypothetical protein